MHASYRKEDLMIVGLALLRILFAVHSLLDALSLIYLLFPQRAAALRAIADHNIAFFIDDPPPPLLRRFFGYWTATMSIARVAAAIAPSVDTFALVTVMYLMEMLVFEYEGFTAHTIHTHRARMVICVSGAIAVATVLMTNWLLLGVV